MFYRRSMGALGRFESLRGVSGLLRNVSCGLRVISGGFRVLRGVSIYRRGFQGFSGVLSESQRRFRGSQGVSFERFRVG